MRLADKHRKKSKDGHVWLASAEEAKDAVADLDGAQYEASEEHGKRWVLRVEPYLARVARENVRRHKETPKQTFAKGGKGGRKDKHVGPLPKGMRPGDWLCTYRSCSNSKPPGNHAYRKKCHRCKRTRVQNSTKSKGKGAGSVPKKKGWIFCVRQVQVKTVL